MAEGFFTHSVKQELSAVFQKRVGWYEIYVKNKQTNKTYYQTHFGSQDYVSVWTNKMTYFLFHADFKVNWRITSASSLTRLYTAVLLKPLLE